MRLVVAGTGTEVGKTWFGAALLRSARTRGLQVAARKPAQSFDPSTAQATDAHLLAAASGELPEDVCPTRHWYEVPMAPPMAADVLARPNIALRDLLAPVRDAIGVDLMLIETAGGVRSPIAHDADNVRLIRELHPDWVVLVADAGLGTLNAVRLSVAALNGLYVAVFLNRYDDADDLHRRNRRWLVERDGLRVFVAVEEFWSFVESQDRATR